MKGRPTTNLAAAVICLMLLHPCLNHAETRAIREVPGDTLFKVELLSPLSTATNHKGDKFECRVMEPAEFSNSLVSGEIRKLKRSGKVEGKSEMVLSFGMIAMPDGSQQNFGAQVVEVYDIDGAANEGRADQEGTLKAKSMRKRDALKIGAGSLAGAIIGGAIAGGKGALAGAAIGALFGSANVLASKGPDLEFKQGTYFILRTDERRSRR